MKFIFFGITQGLTEFLPISSSGHLYLLKKVIGIEGDYLPFFIFLHLATLFTIAFFFYQDINLLKNKKLLLNILSITFITGIVGITVELLLKRFFDNVYLLSACFLFNALILMKAKFNSAPRNWSDINFKDSLVIGLVQGLAAFPGISRSGITIIALLRRGFSKNDSFKLSFLMVIPIILGAFFLHFDDLLANNFSLSNILIGFIFAFFFGIFALRIVKKTLIMERIDKFAYYCLIISMLVLLTSLSKG
ncbi:MAG: undecaprenyl-diphosphate phosphatase [Candidatus Omnitrophica bacterium]|nr:undecaprenyl-diphosphate phosphatase [Candidatus Omnitrophota bacterium]